MKKLIFILLIATACQKDNVEKGNVSGDYIIFGDYYGMCVGARCVQLYKLTEDALYEDTKDKYPPSQGFYDGNYIKLDNARFELVKELRNEVPAELLDIKSIAIGMPDAGDWGGIYFEISINGERRYWLIDMMQSNLPDNIKPFADKINAKLKLLNQ